MLYQWTDVSSQHGPLTRYVTLCIAHAPGMRERFPRHRLQRKPLVSDPCMHHGTCGPHVPWCMSGSLTRGGGENVPGIHRASTTHNFTYLLRGLWILLKFLMNTKGTSLVPICPRDKGLPTTLSISSCIFSWMCGWAAQSKMTQLRVMREVSVPAETENLLTWRYYFTHFVNVITHPCPD